MLLICYWFGQLFTLQVFNKEPVLYDGRLARTESAETLKHLRKIGGYTENSESDRFCRKV